MLNSSKSNEARGYPPPSAVPTYPAMLRAAEPEGWCERNYKNKPQSNSVGAAALIFTSGGMFIVGPARAAFSITKDLEMSWFIGGFIGAIIGAILCNRLRKKLITCFAALLVTISGILLIANSHSYFATISARYINGIAVGLVFPLTFVLAGEEVVKSMRGMNAAATESMCFSIGVFLQMLYINIWPDDSIDVSFDINQMLGLLSVIWGIVSFFIAFTLQIESPISYLARGQEEMTIDTLRRLQRPFIVTYETYEQLEEHKRYLAESKELTFLKSALIGFPALVKLCFYRVLTAWSLSFYTNFAFTYASSVAYPNSIWSHYIYGCLRWIGTSITVFTLDSKGRKPPMIVGFFCCCCLNFAVGGICSFTPNLFSRDSMAAVMYIMMLFQFFAGLSTASSSAYLSEAFPLAIKPYYIAIVFMVEMSLHVVIIACRAQPILFNAYELPEWFCSAGGLTLAFFVVAIVAMPETKLNTLRECLSKFRKLLY